jgi:thiol-disulfide isomerase/thioredoxin
VLGGVLLASSVLGDGPPRAGQTAPALMARTFSGEPIDLGALRGKGVVLNFWASWCVPCRQEMPALDALYKEGWEQGVTVIGLSADDRHDRADAVKAARTVSYPVGLLSEATVNDFGAPQVLPLTYVIARNGTIASVLSANKGALSAAELRQIVSSQLAAANPAPEGADRSAPEARQP